MTNRLRIRRFRRFEEISIDFSANVTIAGPNSSGKTTVLQAILAWDLALRRWKVLNDYRRDEGEYAKAPITRQAFWPVALRSYELLWNERNYSGTIEIEVETAGRSIPIELIADTTEQIFVRPRRDADPDTLSRIDVPITFAAPISELCLEEPVYQRPKIDQLLCKRKSGQVTRNLLVELHKSERSWVRVREFVKECFGLQLLPPDASGPDIVAQYLESGTRLDLACAGSGLQQALMLLSLAHNRPSSVLLVDCPESNLAPRLQGVVFRELRSVVNAKQSQLIVATQSEEIIKATSLSERCRLP